MASKTEMPLPNGGRVFGAYGGFARWLKFLLPAISQRELSVSGMLEK